MQLKAIVELGVAIALVMLVPIVLAGVRVWTRRDRGGDRKIPLRPYEPKPRARQMTNRIDDYLMDAIAATGTRLPTNLPAPPRVARGSIAPPLRAETIRDVTADEFEDDPPTLVTLRPMR